MKAHARRSTGALVWTVGVLLLAPMTASAFTVGITPGARALYLQVGVGSMASRDFQDGGRPRDNSRVNHVSVVVPATELGSGAQAMSSDANVAASPYDGAAFCTVPAQVYVGGFYRRPNAGGNATLTVTTPAALLSAGGDAIAFTAVSWVSGGMGDSTPTIPSGTFNGSVQTLLSVAPNRWFESCLAFSYANGAVFPAGTYTGRATYTLSAP